MSQLFSPIALKSLALPNRIVVPPMCQYSAKEGQATDWYTIHYGTLALSRAGLLVMEATAVEPRGRISPADLGLWDDTTAEALSRTVQAVKSNAAANLFIQLAHAGRKASTSKPWEGDSPLNLENGGWETVAPSAIPYANYFPIPKELNRSDIESIITAFASAAQRANGIGFDGIEIHSAHGYLLHEFLSPLSNRRNDVYGGSLENRMRLTLEVFQAVRNVFPPNKPVGVRISGTDWAEGGWNVDESVILSQELEKRECDYIHISSGGLTEAQKIVLGPNYQVPLAAKIKQGLENMPVITVGLITEPEQAEAILLTGQADMIALGRAMLFNPRWPWYAAAKLGDHLTFPSQYLRCEPRWLKKVFEK